MPQIWTRGNQLGIILWMLQLLPEPLVQDNLVGQHVAGCTRLKAISDIKSWMPRATKRVSVSCQHVVFASFGIVHVTC